MKKILYIISIFILFAQISFAGTGSILSVNCFIAGGTSLNSGDEVTLAKFNAVFLDRLHMNDIGGDTYAAIKAANANTLVFVYVSPHASRPAYDSAANCTGNTLSRWDTQDRSHSQGSISSNPTYIMDDGVDDCITPYGHNQLDITISGMQDYSAEAVATDLSGTACSGDGVFADDMYSYLTAGWLTGCTDPITNAQWQTAMTALIPKIAAALTAEGKYLVTNLIYTEESTHTGSWDVWEAIDDSGNASFGLMTELFFTTMWGVAGDEIQFYPETQWKSYVDHVADATITNSNIFAVSRGTLLHMGEEGNDNYDIAVTFWDGLWYNIGSYLLARKTANNLYTHWGPGAWNHLDYYDEYDLDIGDPIGAYSTDYDGNNAIYAREYDDAWVFVNAGTADDASITLPESVREITHATINTAWANLSVSAASFALPAHRAKIFIKETAVGPSILPSISVGTNQITVGTNQIEIVE